MRKLLALSVAFGLSLSLVSTGLAQEGAPTGQADPECGARPLPSIAQERAQGGDAFWTSFRAPLPLSPVWNPPGQPRVGLQAGHWRNDEVPPELGRLQGGSYGGGKQEWEVNLDIALRTSALLEEAGVAVDILPATIPPGYTAHAFIAIHADGDVTGALHGFKITRPAFSSVPDTDDVLVDDLYHAYAARTGMPRDDEHISRRMLYYYAFNSRRYCHAVSPGVPQAIVETGFLTSAIDRQTLIGNPGLAAAGLADGILAFLQRTPR
jgi:N-acetylmuramoyl-L-alanine amidase